MKTKEWASRAQKCVYERDCDRERTDRKECWQKTRVRIWGRGAKCTSALAEDAVPWWSRSQEHKSSEAPQFREVSCVLPPRGVEK